MEHDAIDPSFIQYLVEELKSQGVFDQLRAECLAEVDTKPSFQNLRQRFEGTVSRFLARQENKWLPGTNKNKLRNQLRSHILQSSYLNSGFERIIDQVLDPKIHSVFEPEVRKVVYNVLRASHFPLPPSYNGADDDVMDSVCQQDACDASSSDDGGGLAGAISPLTPDRGTAHFGAKTPPDQPNCNSLSQTPPLLYDDENYVGPSSFSTFSNLDGNNEEPEDVEADIRLTTSRRIVTGIINDIVPIMEEDSNTANKCEELELAELEKARAELQAQLELEASDEDISINNDQNTGFVPSIPISEMSNSFFGMASFKHNQDIETDDAMLTRENNSVKNTVIANSSIVTCYRANSDTTSDLEEVDHRSDFTKNVLNINSDDFRRELKDQSINGRYESAKINSSIDRHVGQRSFDMTNYPDKHQFNKQSVQSPYVINDDDLKRQNKAAAVVSVPQNTQSVFQDTLVIKKGSYPTISTDADNVKELNNLGEMFKKKASTSYHHFIFNQEKHKNSINNERKMRIKKEKAEKIKKEKDKLDKIVEQVNKGFTIVSDKFKAFDMFAPKTPKAIIRSRSTEGFRSPSTLPLSVSETFKHSSFESKSNSPRSLLSSNKASTELNGISDGRKSEASVKSMKENKIDIRKKSLGESINKINNSDHSRLLLKTSEDIKPKNSQGNLDYDLKSVKSKRYNPTTINKDQTNKKASDMACSPVAMNNVQEKQKVSDKICNLTTFSNVLIKQKIDNISCSPASVKKTPINQKPNDIICNWETINKRMTDRKPKDAACTSERVKKTQTNQKINDMTCNSVTINKAATKQKSDEMECAPSTINKAVLKQQKPDEIVCSQTIDKASTTRKHSITKRKADKVEKIHNIAFNRSDQASFVSISNPQNEKTNKPDLKRKKSEDNSSLHKIEFIDRDVEELRKVSREIGLVISKESNEINKIMEEMIKFVALKDKSTPHTNSLLTELDISSDKDDDHSNFTLNPSDQNMVTKKDGMAQRKGCQSPFETVDNVPFHGFLDIDIDVLNPLNAVLHRLDGLDANGHQFGMEDSDFIKLDSFEFNSSRSKNLLSVMFSEGDDESTVSEKGQNISPYISTQPGVLYCFVKQSIL